MVRPRGRLDSGLRVWAVRHLASGAWLGAWFTSTGFNFPLNLITTVAELFIGFLVATAADRAQDALTVLLAQIRAAVEAGAAIEQGLREAIAGAPRLTRQMHELQVSISQPTGLLEGRNPPSHRCAYTARRPLPPAAARRPPAPG